METAVIPRVAPIIPEFEYAQSTLRAHAGPSRASRRGRGPFLLLGLGLAVVLVLGLLWGLFGNSKSSAPKHVAQTPSSGVPVGGASGTAGAPGPVVTTGASAQASQSTGSPGAGSPGAGSASPGAGVTITPPAGPGGALNGPSGPTTPLATVPGSPQQAVQQIQQLVNQASAGLPQTTVTQLNNTLTALRQEIASASSTQSESATLNQIISGPGFPTGLAGEIEQLLPYLSSFGGS
jgi:hypothetical protein